MKQLARFLGFLVGVVLWPYWVVQGLREGWRKNDRLGEYERYLNDPLDPRD